MTPLWVALKAPWQASPWSSRWLAASVEIALVAIASLTLVATHGRLRAGVAGFFCCAAIAIWWLLVAPNALWLARDATALRLPRARAAANVGIGLHALLSILVPALVLAALMGHLPVWLVAFTLTALGGLLVLLLPAGTFLLVWVVGATLAAAARGVTATWGHTYTIDLHLGTQAISQLAIDAMIPTLGLAAFAAWRWTRLIDAETPASPGFWTPSILNLRCQIKLSLSGRRERRGDALLATRGMLRSLRPTVDLRGAGPGHPVCTIRIALGRSTAPHTWRSLLRQWSLLGALFPCMLLLDSVAFAGRGWRGWFHTVLVPLESGIYPAMLVLAVSGIGMAALLGTQLRSCWRGNAQELALLALLPGLGAVSSVKYAALRACATNLIRVTALQFAALCALGAWLHALPWVWVAASLCAAMALAFGLGEILSAMGGAAVPRALSIASTSALGVLTLVLLWTAFSPAPNKGLFALQLAGVGVACAACCGWCAYGWRALRRRPHPFLSNP